MHVLHLLLALALAMFAAGAPAANSVDVKRQFGPLDKNKIIVKLWPNPNGKDGDINWAYREAMLDVGQCMNMIGIGPGEKYKGISSIRQYEHQYHSKYYCKYWTATNCVREKEHGGFLTEGTGYWHELPEEWKNNVRSMECHFCLTEHTDHQCS